MVTIRDIARELGLSAATVSRALNNDPNISESTRARTAQMAAEMNYTRDLRKKNHSSNRIIGIISPEIVSYNYASVVESIMVNLSKKGLSSTVSITNMDANAEKMLIEMYKNLRVAGIVLIMYQDAASISTLEAFRNSSNIPVVQISNFEEYEGYDSLMISNRLAVNMTVDHLFQLGHKDIGIVADAVAVDRLNAVCNYLQKLGIPAKKNRQVVVPNQRFEEAGYAGAMQLLSGSDKPTAIIAMYDYMAIGVLRACNELNIRVPEDVSVVGIDDINTSAYAYKALTTVSMPHADMGRIAARIMVDRIAEGKNHTAIQHVSLDPVLIVRETTARPRIEN